MPPPLDPSLGADDKTRAGNCQLGRGVLEGARLTSDVPAWRTRKRANGRDAPGIQGVRKLFSPVYLTVISPCAHGTGGNSPRPRLRLSTVVSQSHDPPRSHDFDTCEAVVACVQQAPFALAGGVCYGEIIVFGNASPSCTLW